MQQCINVHKFTNLYLHNQSHHTFKPKHSQIKIQLDINTICQQLSYTQKGLKNSYRYFGDLEQEPCYLNTQM